MSERGAELRALEAAYMAFNARKSLREGEPEFRSERVGDATILVDAARPTLSAYNRVLGLASNDLSQLAELEARFGQLAAPGRYDLDDPSQEVRAALSARGYSVQAHVVYLVAELDAAPSAPGTDVAVRELAHDEVDEFFDLLALSDVGEIAEPLRRLRERHYATEEFPIDIARLEGEVAGWGTSFYAAQGVFLGNAFTYGRFRRCGVQSALFEARLQRAHRRGYAWVATDVEPETSSHRNALRAGFEVQTVRSIWMRAAAEIF